MLVSIGRDGVLMVDAMHPQMHDKIMAAIRKLTNAPVRFVINTHVHSDHTSGNPMMAALGATIISHENMRPRLAAQHVPPEGWPILTYGDHITLYFNDDEIEVFHLPPAHTDGDSYIFFKKANVLHVGDVPASLRYNNIGLDEGGTIDGMIAAGKAVMKIANPQTRIIAGHLGPWWASRKSRRRR